MSMNRFKGGLGLDGLSSSFSSIWLRAHALLISRVLYSSHLRSIILLSVLRPIFMILQSFDPSSAHLRSKY